jgi:hypothetical protein
MAGKHLAVQGDSISAAFGNAWQNIVLARTGMTLVSQDAIAGRTIAQAFQCWGDPALGGTPSVFHPEAGTYCVHDIGFTAGETFAASLADVDVLIVQLGTNGEATPLGALGDSTSTATIYGELRWVIETYEAANPGMRVIVVGPQRNGFATPETTQAIAEAFVAYGRSAGVPVIDMFALGGVNATTSGALTLDGTHPSPLGFSKFYGPVIAQGVAHVL